MANGPVQRAATARVERIASLVPGRDQAKGLRGFNSPQEKFHQVGRVHRPINAPRGRLTMGDGGGRNLNIDNHA